MRSYIVAPVGVPWAESKGLETIQGESSQESLGGLILGHIVPAFGRTAWWRRLANRGDAAAVSFWGPTRVTTR
jgi:hypothetical protein